MLDNNQIYNAAIDIVNAREFNPDASQLATYRETCSDNNWRFTWQDFEQVTLTASSIWNNYRKEAHRNR